MISIYNKLVIFTLLILIMGCRTRNEDLRNNRSLYEKDQTTLFQDFEKIPEQKDGFDLAIRKYEDLWKKKNLTVCWENDSNKNNGKSITQEIVTAEYAKVGFTFTGWNTCDNNGANIRIKVGD